MQTAMPDSAALRLASKRVQPGARVVPSTVAIALWLTVVIWTCMSGAALGSPAPTFSLAASFTPDALGASTNLSMTMSLAQSAGVPDPVSRFVVYGPAGLGLDVRGLATCARAKLELDGPSGCPAQSRVGFGGGVGAAEISGMPVKEPYTLDFFLAPREHGRLAILILVTASSFSVNLVLTAKEVHGPPPYGFGLAVEVPPVHTIPGAANASAETGYVSLGGANVAYYRTVHGVRRLVHVRGLTAPATCPSGGFPFTATVTFEDGTTTAGRYASACPSELR